MHSILKPNLIITGHADHGKDEVCLLLKERQEGLGSYNSNGSSFYVYDKYIFPKYRDSECFKARNIPSTYADGYKALKENENRKFFYDLIVEYNGNDLTRTAREILSDVNIYNGIRNIDEYSNAKKAGLFDYSIWVDAEQRIGIPEDCKDITVTKQDMDFVLNNNGSLEALSTNLNKLMFYIESLWQERKAKLKV